MTGYNSRAGFPAVPNEERIVAISVGPGLRAPVRPIANAIVIISGRVYSGDLPDPEFVFPGSW